MQDASGVTATDLLNAYKPGGLLAPKNFGLAELAEYLLHDPLDPARFPAL